MRGVEWIQPKERLQVGDEWRQHLRLKKSSKRGVKERELQVVLLGEQQQPLGWGKAAVGVVEEGAVGITRRSSSLLNPWFIDGELRVAGQRMELQLLV